MAAQAKEIAVIVAHTGLARFRQTVALRHQAGAGAVFEAAVAVTDNHDLEQVVIHRRRFAVEANVVLADFFQVRGKPFRVAFEATGERDIVRHAAGFERNQLEIAHFDGVIDEIVVIDRAVATETVSLGIEARQRRGHAPVFAALAAGAFDHDLAGLVGLADHFEKNAAAVVVAMRVIEMRGANREVVGIDPVAHAERTVRRSDLPVGLVDLADRDGAIGITRFEVEQVAREVADHVAARDPVRQAQCLSVRVGQVDME